MREETKKLQREIVSPTCLLRTAFLMKTRLEHEIAARSCSSLHSTLFNLGAVQNGGDERCVQQRSVVGADDIRAVLSLSFSPPLFSSFCSTAHLCA